MRKFFLAALLLVLTTAASYAIPRGSSASIAYAPVLQNAAVNEKAWTNAGQGGVALDALLLAPSSEPVDHYMVSTNGPTGYWQASKNALDAGNQIYTALTSTPVSVPNNYVLTTPLAYTGNRGINNSASDVDIQVTNCGGGVSTAAVSSAGQPINIQAGQMLVSRGAFSYPVNTTVLALGTTDPCTGTASTGTGTNAGTYIISATNLVVATQEAEIGDVICGSNGAGIVVFQTETDFTTNTPGVIDNIKVLVQPTVNTTYSIGNVTPNAADCPAGWTQQSNAVNDTFTFNSYGYAESPTPTSTGQTNLINYTGAGSKQTGLTFTITGYDAAGHASNTVTLSMDIWPDGWNISQTALGGVLQDSNLGVGSSSGLQVARNDCINCNSGASSVGDLAIAVSTGAAMSTVNPGTCCGPWPRLTLAGFNYLGAMANASGGKSGTVSPTDFLGLEDACRLSGTLLVAATATSPAINSCDATHGYVASFDGLAFASNNNNNNSGPSSDVCNATGATSGLSGLAELGLNHLGDPRDDYIVNDNTGNNFSEVCDFWVANEKHKFNHTISGGQLTNSFGGNFYNAINVGPYSKHVWISQLYCVAAAGCIQDAQGPCQTGLAPPACQAATDINVTQEVVQLYSNNAETYCPSQFNEDLIYHMQPMLYPLSPLHTDTFQISNQCNPTNDNFNRFWEMQAGGNTNINCFFYGNVSYGLLPQGIRINDWMCAANSSSGLYTQGIDGLTSRSASITNGAMIRQQPPIIGTNASNPSWGFSAQTTILDGYQLPFGVGCQTNVPPGSGGCPPGFTQAQYFLTFKTTVTDPTHQIAIGGSNTNAMHNLAIALGQTTVPGQCPATPTTLGALIAAYSAANGGSGGNFCTSQWYQGAQGLVIYSSTAPSPSWTYLMCPTSGSCSGSTTNWINTQFGVTENGADDNLPFEQESGATVANGPWLALGNTANSTISGPCGAVFTASASGTAMTVSTVYSGTIAIGQTLEPSGGSGGATVPVGTTITGGSGTSWTLSQAVTLTGPAATSSGYLYCGTVTVDKTFIWDNVQGSSNWNTTASAISGLAGTPISFTTNNWVVGSHASCSSCSPVGYFTGDNAYTNGVEGVLESYSDSYWFPDAHIPLSPYVACTTYRNAMQPKPSGPFDINGNQTSAGTSIDFSDHWNGYSTVPCSELQTSGDPYLN